MAKLGNQGLWDMLNGFEDKTAYAQCTYAFCQGPGHEPILFIAKSHGTIVQPKFEQGFGWDPIFKPDMYDITFAEMSAD